MEISCVRNKSTEICITTSPPIITLYKRKYIVQLHTVMLNAESQKMLCKTLHRKEDESTLLVYCLLFYVLAL